MSSTSQTTATAVAGELSATGSTVSPLRLPIALLMIALGSALIVVTRSRGPRRHRA